MFGFFKAATVTDERLGRLTRAGSYWTGTIPLGTAGTFALQLAGTRQSPEASGVTLARELMARYDALKSPIAAQLFEHYEPYRAAAAAEDAEEAEEGSASVPQLKQASDVWSHVVPQWVRIETLHGAPSPGPTIEIAYRVAWDEEHLVGARIQAWNVYELCGSVV